MTGTTWIDEGGFLDGPVLITNTHSVGIVRDATIDWMKRRGAGFLWALPVVAETYDGVLNDLDGFYVKAGQAHAALDSARAGPVREVAVGGGTDTDRGARDGASHGGGDHQRDARGGDDDGRRRRARIRAAARPAAGDHAQIRSLVACAAAPRGRHSTMLSSCGDVARPHVCGSVTSWCPTQPRSNPPTPMV